VGITIVGTDVAAGVQEARIMETSKLVISVLLLI
jgi:hypothetical protein